MAATSAPEKLSFIARAKSGIRSYSLNGSEVKLEENSIKLTETFRSAQYSRDGRSLALINETQRTIDIYDVDSNKLIKRIDNVKAQFMTYSPLGSYIVTWERPVQIGGPLPTVNNGPSTNNNNDGEEGEEEKEEEEEENESNKKNEVKWADNLIVWDAITGETIAKFFLRNVTSDVWPVIQWSVDEGVAVKKETNEIAFYNSRRYQNPRKIRIEDVHTFKISPDKKSLKVATFSPEKKGRPACVKVIRFPEMEVMVSKSFFKAQNAKLVWNSLATSLLVLSSTDKTSEKSYYGESSFHYLSIEGKFEGQVTLKKAGPVHDCAFSPAGTEFIVIYGSQPAQATMFDLKCNPLCDFGEAPRTSVKFNSFGNIVCIAGLGSVQGHLDFWDPKALKKLGSVSALYTSEYEWSPSGDCVLVGVLFPRMKIDNQLKLIKYDGSIIYNEKDAELYQVSWKPTFGLKAPVPVASAIPAAAPPKAKYVHPNARHSTTKVEVKQEVAPARKYSSPTQSNLPPGWTESKSSKKTPNSPAATEKSQQSQQSTSSSQQQPQQQQASSSLSFLASGEDPAKKLKELNKALKEIETLKKQQSNPDPAPLDDSQKSKLASESTVRSQIAQLNKIVKK